MKRLFVGSLSPDTSEASLRELFAPFGTVHSLDLARDIFTGTCKGFGFVEMEGHEARAAQKALDGTFPEGGEGALKVRFEQPRRVRRGGRR
jgi:RNA recognition motif-containing protein